MINYLIPLLFMILLSCTTRTTVSDIKVSNEPLKEEASIDRTTSNKTVEDVILFEPDSTLLNDKGIYGVELSLNKVSNSFDLNSDGKNETITYLNNSETKEHIIKINDQEFKVKDYESWGNKGLFILDINKKDGFLEVLFYQHFDESEDPGRENYILTYQNNQLVSSTISGTDYNAGSLTILGNDTVDMYLSSCPNYENDYFILTEGKLKKVKSKSIPNPDFPDGSCPACFIAGTKVKTGGNQHQEIQDLKKGDVVLTYNMNTKKVETTVIESMIKVDHDELIVLYVANELMTSDNITYDSVVVTYDHPFYTQNKGWCSFSPAKTMKNYSGYNEVKQYADGDKIVVFENGLLSSKVIVGHQFIKNKQATYTISKLKKGNNFFANGLLVGVEEIKVK